MTDVQETRDLIQAVIKAKKNLRMYPQNNPIYVKSVDDIYTRMSSILDYTESIIFKCKQYEIIASDEVIYHKEEKDDNFALFFFKDGLRELTFRKGIPRDEVEEFLKIISQDFEKEVLDDDIVTLMWEKDFQYIKYIVDDAVLLEDETYEERAIHQVKDVSAGSEEILKAYEDAMGKERAVEVTIVPLSNDDVKSIIEEIENDPSDKTLRLAQLLFEMLFHAEGKGDLEDLSKLIKDTLQYAVSQGNLQTAVYTIKKIKSSIESQVYPEEVHAHIRGVEYFINSAVFIKQFGEILDRGAELSDDLTREFSFLLNKSAIPHFINILGDLESIAARKVTINILAELGKKDITLLAQGLKDKKWYVVRNIVLVLRRIGNKAAGDYLIGSLLHPDVRVRKEAIRALGEMGTAGALKPLADCLTDDDESIRIASIRSIGLIGMPAAKRIVLDRINDKPFRDKSFTEKKEFFEVLSQWKEEDVINTVIRILKKKTLFRRTKNDETRASAAYGVGLMSAPEAMNTLEKLERSKNKLLRDNVLAAVKRIRSGTA
jgi:HEAT repeat protein